jgi:N-acetylmuramoyl-L-alanine amidase
MAKFICLQAGHQGVTTGATGAPGEQELNIRIRDRLSQILISKGFMLQLVNAHPTQQEINKDFDLFLALHGDANIYGTGGGVVSYIASYLDSSTASNAESNRIHQCIEDEYFPNTGIVNHPERNNLNMTEYYMWSQLTAITPCVIMEMGVVQDAHDKVILADTSRVANAIARGICTAFGVPFDYKPPVIVPPVTTPIKDWKPYLTRIKTILYEKSAWWTRLTKIRDVIAEAGI